MGHSHRSADKAAIKADKPVDSSRQPQLKTLPSARTKLLLLLLLALRPVEVDCEELQL